MATLKQRLHRKNASGTYDTIHYESASDLILRPSGRSVEQDLTDFLPRTQATDDVPKSLHFGTYKTPLQGVLGHIFGVKTTLNMVILSKFLQKSANPIFCTV